MKKTIILTLSAMLALPAVGFAEGSSGATYSNQPFAKVAEVNNVSDVKTVEVPSVQRLTDLYNQLGKLERQNWQREIHDYPSFEKLMYDIYTELPNSVIITTSLSRDDLREFEDIFHKNIHVSKLPNYMLLGNYPLKKYGVKYSMSDNSHKIHSAKEIETVTKQFAKEFAESISYLSSLEKFQVIYDYVHSQYSYIATSSQNMMVGNAENYQMACNGFSRMMYELLNASGIETRLIQADDHFYNHVKQEDVFGSGDSWFTVDVTTDILLKKKHGATGLSEEDYLNYVSRVGFYWAKPIAKETSVSTPLTNDYIDKIHSQSVEWELKPQKDTPSPSVPQNTSTSFEKLIHQTKNHLNAYAKSPVSSD